MKKKLQLLAATVVLLLLISFTFFQYRDYRSYKNRVHKNACLVFKVNVDGLIKNSSTELTGILSSLFSEHKSNTKITRMLPQGIKIPANVFVYTVFSKSMKTFFCSLQVTDSTTLRSYLEKGLQIGNFTAADSGRVFGNSSNNKIHVAYDARNLAISYSFKEEMVKDVLNEMLEGRSFLSEQSPLIRRLKSEDGPISYTYKSYSGSLKVRDSTLVLEGTMPISKLDIPRQSYRLSSKKADLAAEVWLNARLKRLMIKNTLLMKGYTMEEDSLAKYYHGYAGMEVGKTITQHNELITYTYNDDFEKTEELKVSEVKVPEINVTLDGDARRLAAYMEAQLVINKEHKLCKDLFPLYDVYSTHNEDILQFSTNRDNKVSAQPVKTPYFFFAEIDFNKIKQEQHFAFLDSYISHLSSLKARASKKNSNEGLVKIELTFREKAE